MIVSGDSVTNASTGFDESGFPQVNITLDMQGGRSLQKATTGNIGRRLGVLFVEQKSRSEIVINDQGEEIIEQTPYVEKKIITADERGQVHLSLLPGRQYLFDSVKLQPIKDADPVKNAEWESLWAALTFAVPDS